MHTPVQRILRKLSKRSSRQLKIKKGVRYIPYFIPAFLLHVGPPGLDSCSVVIFNSLDWMLLSLTCLQASVQIFGVLDVERVAGNFHISMHGLSLYVAQQV